MAQRQQSGSGHIIDHLSLELLLLYIHILGYVKGTLRVYLAECVDGKALKLPSLFINTQMTTLYINWSLYITFTMIYYIRQE